MFYKGKIPLFSEKCGFQPPPYFHRISVVFDYWFYRKSVFWISLGITYLPIYYKCV